MGGIGNNKLLEFFFKMSLLMFEDIFKCLHGACLCIAIYLASREMEHTCFRCSHETIACLVALCLLFCFLMKVVSIDFDDNYKWRSLVFRINPCANSEVRAISIVL